MSATYNHPVSTPLRVFSALVFGLWLWMFLPPMADLQLVNNVASFTVVFIALVIGQMTPWRWLRFVLAVLATELYMVKYFAPDTGVLGGLLQVTQVELAQVRALLSPPGAALVDPLQTHAFLSSICVIYWLVAYAGRRIRLWVFYNLLAVVVLAIIDGNTSVHPNLEIVIIMILFVSNLGALQYQKLRGHFLYTVDSAQTARFFTPLAVLLAVCLTAAWVLPKAGPAWADPTKAIAAWRNNAAGNAVQMIGYQEDNSHLGGSFIQNHDQVLSMVSDYPAYLRGKVYSVYTGKGWEDEYTPFADVAVGDSFAEFGTDPKKLPGRTVQQKIEVLSDGLHARALFGAYSMQKVSGLDVPQGTALQVATDSDVVYGPPLRKGQTYTVTSYEMADPFAKLEKLPDLPPDTSSAFPEDIRRQYLILPEVPERVHQLAEKVAGNTRNEYDIVVKIRDYLRSNYVYETQGIPVPQGNEDYVDQFLFESRKGYCNNFSSAMAVMLRTLGIPTRWVTGFAEGTLDPTYSGSGFRYIYENADAHSWVEVYFPNVGWVPFDPTPNFYIPFAPAVTSDDTPSTPATTVPDKPSKPKPLHNLDSDPGSTNENQSNPVDWSAVMRTAAYVVLALALGVAVLLYLFRSRVRELRLRWTWRQLTTRGMLRALRRLVSALQSSGEVPPRATTLRDLHRAAKTYGVSDTEFRHLVQTAESHWYGNKTPTEEELARARKTWLQWILQIGRRY